MYNTYRRVNTQVNTYRRTMNIYLISFNINFVVT